MTTTAAPASAAPKPDRSARVRFGTGVLFSSMAEIWATAKAFVENGIAPKGATAASVAASIIKGIPLGLDPVTAMSTITVVNGRAKSDVVLRLGQVRRSGLTAAPGYWRRSWVGTFPQDDFGCRIEACRADTREPQDWTFTVKDAKTAGLWGKNNSPWIGYVKRMLYNRAAGYVLDDLFSDVTLGWDHAGPDEDEPEQLPAAPAPATLPEPASAPMAALPEASQPDPLLSMNGALKRETVEAEVVPPPPFASHAEADAVLAAEEQAQEPKGCPHSAVRFPVPPGRLRVCTDCGQEFRGPTREPGDDSDEQPALPGMGAAKKGGRG